MTGRVFVRRDGERRDRVSQASLFNLKILHKVPNNVVVHKDSWESDIKGRVKYVHEDKEAVEKAWEQLEEADVTWFISARG